MMVIQGRVYELRDLTSDMIMWAKISPDVTKQNSLCLDALG